MSADGENHAQVDYAGPEGLGSISERLGWAIKRRPPRGRERGVRMFQRDMESRAEELRKEGDNVPGITLPSILTYLNGEVLPSIAFLREAASVLGVREPWLISGQGQPTEHEATVSQAAQDSNLGEGAGWDWRHVVSKIGQSFGEGGERFQADAPLKLLLLSTWGRLAFGGLLPTPPPSAIAGNYPSHLAMILKYPDYDTNDPEDRRVAFAVARFIGRMLREPFNSLPIQPQTLSNDELLDYSTAVCQGLRRLVDSGERHLLERAHSEGHHAEDKSHG